MTGADHLDATPVVCGNGTGPATPVAGCPPRSCPRRAAFASHEESRVIQRGARRHLVLPAIGALALLALLAPIHEDGDTAKATLAQGFARYDCDSGTLYLLVQTAPGWYLIPTKEDSFVKSGDTVLVDVETGNDGTAPDV